jgi:hypothetical protein
MNSTEEICWWVTIVNRREEVRGAETALKIMGNEELFNRLTHPSPDIQDLLEETKSRSNGRWESYISVYLTRGGIR